jgi:hypothetical protein
LWPERFCVRDCYTQKWAHIRGWAATAKSVIRTALTSLTRAVPIADFPNLAKQPLDRDDKMQPASGRPGSHIRHESVTVVKEVDDGLSVKTVNSSEDHTFSIIANQTPSATCLKILRKAFTLSSQPPTSFIYLDAQAPYCGYRSSMCPYNTAAECSSTANYLVYAFVHLPTAS